MSLMRNCAAILIPRLGNSKVRLCGASVSTNLMHTRFLNATRHLSSVFHRHIPEQIDETVCEKGSWQPDSSFLASIDREWIHATPSLDELIRDDIPEARILFRNVLQNEYPKDMGMWNKWAVMEWKAGNFDLARMIFRKASKIQFDYRLWQSWASMESECNNYAESKRLFHVILATNPKCPLARLGLVLLEAKQGYDDRAREAFLQLSEEYPEDLNIIQSYAIFEAKQHNIERSRELFEMARELTESNGQFWHGWAKVEYDNGYYEIAVRVVERGLNACPNHKWLITLLAMSHYKLGDLDEARKVYEYLVNTENFIDPATYNAYAKMEEEAGNFDTAQSLYVDALTTYPEHLPSVMSFATLQAKLGNLQDARQTFERAISAVKDVGELFYVWGCFEEQHGTLKHAVQLLEEATSRDESLLQAWKALARVHGKLKNIRAARAVLRKATESIANSAPLLLELANIEKLNHRYDAARKAYEKACKADSTSSTAWNQRATYELPLYPERCKTYIEEALQSVSEHDIFGRSVLYCTYARACAELSEFEYAITAFENSFQLVPRNAETHLLFASCVLIPLQGWEDAKKHLDTAARFHRDPAQLQKIKKKLLIVEQALGASEMEIS